MPFLAGDRGVAVCVFCGPRPGGHLAQSCPLCSLYLVLPKVPPAGCLRLLSLRPSSGSPPLGSLPWLPTLPMGRISYWEELGAGPFPMGLVGGCPPAQGAPCSPGLEEPVQRPQVARAWTGSHPEAQGCPAMVDGLRHWLGPEGLLFEVELGQDT